MRVVGLRELLHRCRVLERTTMSLETTLQIAGWAFTVTGQIQVALKDRRGFLTWIAANAVLIALSAVAGLWWSVGMFLTNVATCVWSYLRWGARASRARARPAVRRGQAVPRWRAFAPSESTIARRRARATAARALAAEGYRGNVCPTGSGLDPG
jgi:hypothetical protein